MTEPLSSRSVVENHRLNHASFETFEDCKMSSCVRARAAQAEACPTCKGKGWQPTKPPNIPTSKPCPSCIGTGRQGRK